MDHLYLDDNSTRKYSPRVVTYIQSDFVNDYANASSEHDAGFILSGKIKECRKIIGDRIGSSTKKIVFTSGATESINTVLSVDNLEKLKIKTIISSRMEHHATLHQLDYLVNKGFNVEFVRNDHEGRLDYDHLKEISNHNPKAFLTFLYVNNETGVINDVKKITDVAHESESFIHLDAVQALGKLDFDLDDIDCDFASFSGHKIGSFKGIGLLYVKDIEKFEPLLHGGGQEKGYRPGTYNYPAIMSFSLAIQDIDFSLLTETQVQRNRLESEFKSINSSFAVNCEGAIRVANTSNLYFGGKDCRELMLKLSRKNIFVSTGAACNGSNPEPSHVLKSIRAVQGVDSLRISSSFSANEVNAFLDGVRDLFS